MQICLYIYVAKTARVPYLVSSALRISPYNFAQTIQHHCWHNAKWLTVVTEGLLLYLLHRLLLEPVDNNNENKNRGGTVVIFPGLVKGTSRTS